MSYHNIMYRCRWMVIALLMTPALLLSCKDGQQDDKREESQMVYLHVYEQARQMQHKGDFEQAVSLFKQCLSQCEHARQVSDSLVETAANTMVQLMNTYQSMGRPEACIDYFTQMTEHPSGFIRRYCLRDAYVLLAYSLSRTDKEEEGARVMDKALRMELVASTHDRLFRDYAYAAAVYFCLAGRQADVSSYGRKALAEARLSKSTSGAQWVSALLGIFYRRNGDITAAIDMYEESFQVAKELGDTLGMANARNSMADLLLNWKMPDYAADYASQAVAIMSHLSNTNPMVMCNVMVNQAKVKVACGQMDSASHYIDKAQTYCQGLPYNSGQSEVDLQRARLYMADEGTMEKGIGLMKKVADKATVSVKAQALCELARVYMKRKDDARVDQMLMALYATLTNGDSPIMMIEAYELGLRYYLKKGDDEKAALFAKRLFLPDYDHTKMFKRMATTLVKFQTRQKENALQMQEMAAEKHMQTVVTVCLLVVLALAVWVAILIYSHRMAQIKKRLVESQLKNLSDQVSMLTTDKEMMRSKLEAIRMEEMKSGNVNPKLLRENGEEEFRDHFRKLYPMFIKNLRETVPNISRSEELLCMLIALGQSTNQIERILCVAHNSVNMARYRLRTKMKLEKGQVLETVIKDILARE